MPALRYAATRSRALLLSATQAVFYLSALSRLDSLQWSFRDFGARNKFFVIDNLLFGVI